MHRLRYYDFFFLEISFFTLAQIQLSFIHICTLGKKTPKNPNISYGDDFQSFISVCIHCDRSLRYLGMYSSTGSLSNHKPSFKCSRTYTVAQNDRRVWGEKNQQTLKTSFVSDKKLKCILMCANFSRE